MTSIAQHEPDPEVPGRCKHCGGKLSNAGSEFRCRERPGAEPPPRAWHGSALDDGNSIAARLAELRREREKIEAATAEKPNA